MFNDTESARERERMGNEEPKCRQRKEGRGKKSFIVISKAV